MDKPKNLKISVDDTRRGNSSIRYLLVYDPEDHEVYTTYLTGPGTPVNVYHRLAVTIRLSVETTAELLADCLEGLRGEFEVLRQDYLGSEFVCGNRRGYWADSAAAAEALQNLMLAVNALPCYCHPADWICEHDAREILRKIRAEKKTVADVAEDLNDEAWNNGILIDSEDLAAYLADVACAMDAEDESEDE